MTTTLKVKINSSFQHGEVQAILDTNPGLARVIVLKSTVALVPSEFAEAFAGAIEDRWNVNRASGYQTNAICSVRRQLANARGDA